MKKGLSLPINLIVILAIAILVMVVVAAFFVGVFAPSTGGIGLDTALSQACQKLRSLYNCASSSISTVTIKYQALGDAEPRDYTLQRLCEKKSLSVDECVKTCGCPGETTTGEGAVPAEAGPPPPPSAVPSPP